MVIILILLVFPSYAAKANANENETIVTPLVSPSANFELGFFSPGNSTNSYLGIWYKNLTPMTVVWVANRESPLKLNHSSGLLKLTQLGLLVLLTDNDTVLWSSQPPSTLPQTPTLQLLDSGIRDSNQTETVIWQSFDHPTDTFLQGMTFGLGSVSLTSWKSNDDPSPGDYTISLDQSGYPQLLTRKSGVLLSRIGPWNGFVFSGTPRLRNENRFTFGLYRSGSFFYLREDPFDKSFITRTSLNPNGVTQRWAWVDQTQDWVLQINIPSDNCDTYNTCGAYGSCNIASFPLCQCLDRFVPKDPGGWAAADWSTNGCVRRRPLSNCSARDVFVKYSNLKLADARNSWYDETMTLEECRMECLRNCSCSAYTTLNISGEGSGCLNWFQDLVDIRALSVDGQDIYIRMDSSELESNGKRGRKLKLIIIVILATVGLLVLMLVLVYLGRTRKKGITQIQNNDLDLPLFHLSTISRATNNFSFENKLGEGGYGPVYKGTLQDGQDIAVKRMSEISKQGDNEFKNEIIFIAKLQHRNLVKLLGYCIQGDEKMLIYEYMPNKSLDMVIFAADETNRISLDWPKRFHIVNGIARALMYLHQDSRLRIIHRDLKASNILLDGEMNPKISDFGIAKKCMGNETEEKTNRVVGTYGYMSPEYAVHGRYSIKSDVFSFGVIVLEIVSGKRNSSYTHRECQLSLLAHAWMLYKEMRLVELVDSSLLHLDNLEQVFRLVHVGLLCVQQHPDDRPTMSYVVAMLSNENELPQPNQPGFYAVTKSNASTNPMTSGNDVTITLLGGR